MNTFRRRLWLGALLSLALVLPAAPGVQAASGLSLSLDCYSSRERITIKNPRTTTVTIRTIGSLYKPYSNEPFTVNRKLAAGKSVTYYTGSGASATSSMTLTRRNIFNNSVSTEGVRVTSSIGTFSRRC
jgi:hypothetical protein